MCHRYATDESCTAEAHTAHSRLHRRGPLYATAAVRRPRLRRVQHPPRPTQPTLVFTAEASDCTAGRCLTELLEIMLHGCSQQVCRSNASWLLAEASDCTAGRCLTEQRSRSLSCTSWSQQPKSEQGSFSARIHRKNLQFSALYQRGSRIRHSTRAEVHRSHADKSLSEDPSIHKFAMESFMLTEPHALTEPPSPTAAIETCEHQLH